jgi:hypothetical protein
MEMSVIAAERPRSTIEESVGSRGRRRIRGTYVLDRLPDGGTRIRFDLAWLEAPAPERLAAPLTRALTRHANATALRRLAELLAGRRTASVSAAGEGGPASKPREQRR